LSIAVADEFKKIGSRDDLCKIHVVKGKPLVDAQIAFDGFWKALKVQIGLTGLAGDALATPDSIGFHDYRPATWVEHVNDDDTQKACAYAQRLSSTRPISVGIDSRDAGEMMMNELRIVLELINAKSADEARAQADAGNAESAIDYALRCVIQNSATLVCRSTLCHSAYFITTPRLQFGFKCPPSRRLSRVYLLKALSSSSATSVHKSMAHALLIDWYTAGDDLRKRYLHGAAYHANQAVQLASGQACPAVLFFGARILEPNSYKALEFCVQYKAVWAALDARQKEMEKEQSKAEEKRMKRANRYRCANVGCSVQADTGKMLSQCE
jgi:hypothetical protein